MTQFPLCPSSGVFWSVLCRTHLLQFSWANQLQRINDSGYLTTNVLFSMYFANSLIIFHNCVDVYTCFYFRPPVDTLLVQLLDAHVFTRFISHIYCNMIGPPLEWTICARHSKRHRADIIECLNAKAIRIALGALNAAENPLLRIE